MFLQDLNDNEKKAFLTLALEFIVIDGQLDTEEELLVEQMQREMGVTTSYKPEEKSREELLDIFESRRSKVVCVIEMQALGYANMEYHTKEIEYIAEMAKHFGITPQTLQKIDKWVLTQLSLLYEAHEFWDDDPLEFDPVIAE